MEQLNASNVKSVSIQALRVRGGETTTPFDMVVRNDLGRFHLMADVIHRVPKLASIEACQTVSSHKLVKHTEYIDKYG